jgi:prophage antirepressor-like protein
MQAITVFDFGGRKVRTAGTHEAPLFCAADVCEILTLGDVSCACERLDQDEVELVAGPAKNSHERVGPGTGTRAYKVLYVTESGLYALILGCIKPEAKVFRKWITSEVLPEIRKRGYYDALEVATRKQTALLLEACFPLAPTKAKPIFSGLISALLKMRGEPQIGNPPWAPLLASIIYDLAIPVKGQQAKRRELSPHPNGSRVDHSMLSDEVRAHVLAVAQAGTALAKNSHSWDEWRACMDVAFRDAPLQLSLLTPVRRLPARAPRKRKAARRPPRKPGDSK